MRNAFFLLAVFAAGALLGATVFRDREQALRASAPRGQAGPQEPMAPREQTSRNETPPGTPKRSPAVNQLLRRARQPSLPAGTGRITGSVRTKQGEPVEGIRISATPTDHASKPTRRRRFDRYGPPKPADLDAVALDAVENALWYDAVRVTALTDTRGEFALEGLLDAKYRIYAAAREWEVRPRDYTQSSAAQAGAVVDFLARPVLRLDVTILDPDGREPSRARMRGKRKGASLSGDWTPQRREFRIPRDGGTWEIWAESSLYGVEAPRSAPVQVEARAGVDQGPLLFQLVGPTGLRAMLEMPQGLGPNGLRFRLRGLAPGERADPASLVTARDVVHGSPREGRCRWTGLEPGRYLVGVGWGGEFYEPLAHAVVEVSEGMAECVLRVAPPPAQVTRVVRVLGPDGKPIQESVQLMRTMESKAGPLHRTLPWVRQADGSLLVHLRPPDFRGTGKNFLTAYAAPGIRRAGFDPSSRAPIEVRFFDPVHLVVGIEGWGKTGLEGRLSVRARSEDGMDQSVPVDAAGRARFERAQPGRYRLALILSQRKSRSAWTIAETQVEVTPQQHRITLPIPRLYGLRIHCPGCEPGAQIYVFGRGKRRGFGALRVLPESRVVEFEEVPAGPFSATAGRVRMDFEVSGATEITLK